MGVDTHLWSWVAVVIAKICTYHLLPETWFLPKLKHVEVECPADFQWHLDPDQDFEVVRLVEVPSQGWCISISLCLQTITNILDGTNLCLSGKTFGTFEKRGKRPSYQSLVLLKKGGGSHFFLMKTCSREDGPVKTLLEGLLKCLENNSSSYRNKTTAANAFS